MNRFWLWLCRFAFRRLKQRVGYRELPTGVPFLRDVDNVCYVYSPRERLPGDWADCQGDGHYLCRECALLRCDEEQEERN